MTSKQFTISRKLMEMTQEELALKLGVDVSSIQQIEAGGPVSRVFAYAMVGVSSFKFASFL